MARRRDLPLLSIALHHEADVVLARQRARHVAELLGASRLDQTRLATAVSEVARNAVTHGGGGRAHYSLANTDPPFLVVRVEDHGPGLSAPVAAPPGDVRLGPGSGLVLTRRLVDELEVDSPPGGGLEVTLRKRLPASAGPLTPAALRRLADELARRRPGSPLEELQVQQQELLATLADLTSRQEALAAANLELEETNRGVMALYDSAASELEETNRGVVALYAQLDDQAQRLRDADAAKNRFISYLSHEFRTPLHAMGALSRLLLERADGPLTDEQQRQVELIAQSARDLLGMVDDILDLAKIEAGKLEVIAQELTVEDVLTPLRLLFRPLAAEAHLELVFVEEADLPPLVTDAQKLAQILRNLIGNAIKFTERGEVRVTARRDGPDALAILVTDTGIGIAPEAQQQIFEEYEQVRPSPGQRTRGTGLGLPLSRRLATLLGGSLVVASAPGAGSTFTLRLPLRRDARPAATVVSTNAVPSAAAAAPPAAASQRQASPQALVVDDDPAARYVLGRALAGAGWAVDAAATGEEGLGILGRGGVDLLVLDLGLPGMSGFDLLEHLADVRRSRPMPVVVCTSAALTPEELARLRASARQVVLKTDPGYGEAVAAIAVDVAHEWTEDPGEEQADR